MASVAGHRSGVRDLSDRLGWSLLLALTVAVLLSWTPSLPAALGDNHEGRILGRHALHVTNAQQEGLAASGWLSDWSPYVGGNGEQTSYAHHPPLMNFGYLVSAELLPFVRTETALRWFAYVGGVASLPVGAAILRRRGLRWLPTLASTAAIAVTPLFWAYGRLNASVTLLLAMTLMIVRVREDRRIGLGELALACLVSFVAVLAGYLGLATAALLGLWLLAGRRLDRVTVSIGVAMAAGAAITAGYVLGGSGQEELSAQLELRATGGGFTATEFADRIARWARELLPLWWRWLLAPAALVAGLLDRRVRPLVAILTLVAVAYVVGLPNGSFVHDYWIYPVLLPVWFGGAALLQGLEERVAWWRPAATAVAAAVVLVVGVTGLVRAEVPQEYFTQPEAAGNLVRDVGPADGQAIAWRTSGIATPRWLSWYWQLPSEEVTAETLPRVGPQELVLVRLDRVPEWLGPPETLGSAAVERRDGYALFTGAALQQAAAATDGASGG